MEEKKLGKPKISLQFQLSESGLTELIKAEAAVEETYTVEEEVEVDDDEGSEEDSDEKVEGDATDSATEEDEKAADRKLEGDEEDTNATKAAAMDANSTTVDEPPKENPKKKKTILQEKVSQVACNMLTCCN